VRIIAGRFKGRRLSAPTWPGLRPTSDKLRETLFNVVRDRVDGARLLDGYAGTGAVGIEALSRGAAHVTFVERDPRACRLIAGNLAPLGVDGSYTVERTTLAAALGRSGRSFDLVFLDPPYDADDLEAAVAAGCAALEVEGLLILEHAARREPPGVAGARTLRTIRAGDSALTFYAREAAS
jgi:16S rRNA (guanine(966)-N(2))-methyltransferase RsmD